MIARDPATRATRWRRISLIVAALVVALFGFATWYKLHYSMQPAHSFEVQGSAAGPRVLIATQGSPFKDAVLAGLVEHLKTRAARAQVIDVATLAKVHAADWDVIVILHTWEMHKPPPAVAAFIDRVPDRHKLVVLTTSGGGDFRMPGVDAISAASKRVDVPARVLELSRRIDAVLDARPPGRAP
jgi:hypothetical protein